MAARNLTLTSIGLPIRTELRLKSMLEVVKNMTVDNWSYSQEGEADLAICEPHSALTAVAIKRAQSPGATRCALLVKDERIDAAFVPIIHDPVRPTEFLSLLNSISEQATHRPKAQSADVESGETSNSSADFVHSDDNTPLALALALRAAAMNTSGKAVRLQVGSIELHVLNSPKIVLQSKELDAFEISELAERHDKVRVTEVPIEAALHLQQSGHQRATMGSILWRLGVFGPRDRLVPIVSSESQFKLKRWPDFGRLEHTADHLRLAARLSRQFVGVTDLAVAIAQPIEKVRPFLNACVLCELMLVEPVTHESPLKAVPQKTAQAGSDSKYKGLFQSIRSALNFAIS
jgi:hypothetical protein